MTKPAPLLILGGTGQVARALARACAVAGQDVVVCGKAQWDLAHQSPADLIAQVSPSAVINASAYTAVDKAEAEPGAARRLNAEVPGLAAAACKRLGISYVHFSTDCVFDGAKTGAYREDDVRRPISVYGQTKADGEDAVRDAGGRFAILRTSWVYDSQGTNFVTTMIKLAQTRDEIGVVSDQVGRPTTADTCALAALTAVSALNTGLGSQIFHIAGAGDVDRASFAQTILAMATARGGPASAIKAIATADFPTPARRPANSSLDTQKAQKLLGLEFAPWPESLAQIIAEIYPTGAQNQS